MRIAVLATNRNPLREPYAGGQESLTAALVAGFQSRGHEVVLFAADGTPSQLAHEVLNYPKLPRLSQVAALDPQIPEKSFLGDHHAFTAAVSWLSVRDDIDVIANHTLHHLPLSLSSLLPAPVVTTLHTPPFPWLELGAALAAPSAQYVAVSRAVASQWTTLAPQVIANGVDEKRFAYSPSSENRQPVRLVWVGRIVPEKAPHLAMRVAHETGLGLDLIGPIADEAYWKHEVQPLLRDGITYRGALSQNELVAALGWADALLTTPVWEEPFGLVAVEAAMCGTAVIALERGGLREVVSPKIGALVADDDGCSDAVRVRRLSRAVRDFAAVPDGEGLRDRATVAHAARSNFSLSTCIDRHLQVLQKAAQAVKGT